jgi:hypothetical protein
MRHGHHAAIIMLGLGTLLLGGCSLFPERFGAAPEGIQPIAPERSIVQLPHELEQERLAVRRQVERGVLQERVVLGNNTAVAGENAIVVHTRWRGDPWYMFTSGRFANPYTESGIDERIAGEFGGWQAISPPAERVNRHGRYRYIEAADEDVRCVLAWQMIDATASLTGEVNSYALDFRFCDARRGPEDLLALFDQLDLQPYL